MVPRADVSLPLAAPVTMPIGAASQSLVNSLQSSAVWGIFAVTDGAQGTSIGSAGTLSGYISATGGTANASDTAEASTYSVDYAKEMRISDFPVEKGGFASYNKVEMPGEPRVTLMLDGSVDDRTALLALLDYAAKSTNLYNVVTPEAVYTNCTIQRYGYQRAAAKGANMLIIDVTLKEIRQVSAAYTVQQISKPQNPSAAPQQSGGIVQSPSSTPTDRFMEYLRNGGS